MTPHFTLAEFEHSAIALRKGLDNRLPPELMPAALMTLEQLERIRAHLSRQAGRDVPMIVLSGYRAPAVNMAVGSKSTSDHPKAAAADWVAPSFGTPGQICRALAPHVSTLGIGQLILEFGRWVHTSTLMPERPINTIITISAAGVMPGIVGT